MPRAAAPTVPTLKAFAPVFLASVQHRCEARHGGDLCQPDR